MSTETSNRTYATSGRAPRNSRASIRVALWFAVLIIVCLEVNDRVRVGAFTITAHRRLTMEALKRRGVMYNGARMEFSDGAAHAIDMEAAAMDRGAAIGIGYKPEQHFDNEKLKEGAEHLVEMKQKVIQILTSEKMSDQDLRRAYRYFALGIHGVQDFYAHTNWVELKDDVCPTLGVGPFQVALADPNGEETCTDKFKLSGAGLTKLTSGYWTTSGCNVPFPKKCHHGKDKSSCEGIAKDSEGDPKVKVGDPANTSKHDPDGKFHDEAESLAIRATQAYANLILSDPQVQKHCDNVNRFLRAKFRE